MKLWGRDSTPCGSNSWPVGYLCPLVRGCSRPRHPARRFGRVGLVGASSATPSVAEGPTHMARTSG